MDEPLEPDVAPTQVEAEIARKTSGQRHINLIWEFTQGFVAIAVTIATLLVAVRLSLKDQPAEASFLLLSNAFFLVVGFYFGRTNHQRSGGVGAHNDEGR